MKKKLAPFARGQGNINFKSQSVRERGMRTFLIPIGLIVIFLIFFIRLFHLTVVKGTYYRFLSENNRIKELSIDGVRGSVYDRKGHKLIYTTELPRENEHDSAEYKRIYNDGEYYSHVLGYRQIASETNFEEDACAESLKLNDKIGVRGVEKLFECHLRAQKGKHLIEVDAHGDFLKTLSKVDPVQGKDIRLSIDSELQSKAYELIRDNQIKTNEEIDYSEKKISIIAIDPRTGEILVLLSYPSYNPQVFEDSNDEQTQKYLTDKEKPLYNRALLGTYPPGSVFKPFVAIGALEEEVISPTDTIQDNGYIEAGPIRFHNWYYTQYGKTEGEVDMVKGLQRSNDIYFYKIGEKLTADKIKVWSDTFGFGKHTGIDLEDSIGVVPSDFWKQETIGERWFLGDTYNLSIGQGYMLTTPLQIAVATATIANDGKVCKPQILRLDADENEDLLEDNKPECESLNLKKESLDVVKEGMLRACEPKGTAWPFFDFRTSVVQPDSSASPSSELTKRLPVGCKTGTAQSQGEETLPHAWFTIFAPFDNPEIVLAVLVEESGEGSSIAAPIAKEVLQTYFERSE